MRALSPSRCRPPVYPALAGLLLACSGGSAGPTAGVAPSGSKSVEADTAALANQNPLSDPADYYPTPQAEEPTSGLIGKLPPVPEMKAPDADPAGRSVKSMRLSGKDLQGQEVNIKGYITWIYDCAAALRKPGMSEKQLKKLLEYSPERCHRPHFFLGDGKDDPERTIVWVVEVPRELRRDERRALTKAEIAARPPVPDLAVGDQVIVTGLWNDRSPHGFFNSDGLLVYGKVEHLSKAPRKSRK